MQTYQRESKPIQDVYAQVTQLFGSAPDLLEDFKQFLPESAAQAKAQAAAARQQQVTEEVTMISNVRNDPYVAAAQHNQSQTPRNELKMPPVGNFAPPQSTSKENKKRRGGAGSQTTGGATAPEVPSLTIGHSIKNGNLRSNVSKVSGVIILKLLKGCQVADIFSSSNHFPGTCQNTLRESICLFTLNSSFQLGFIISLFTEIGFDAKNGNQFQITFWFL